MTANQGVSLEECAARLTWAREHIAKLQNAESESVGQLTNMFVVDVDPSTGRYRLGRREVPIAGGVVFMAGDAVHNLRSTLDHLVWQLRMGARQSFAQQMESSVWTQHP